ncbi:hypothetical protein FGB62_22g847 [Gracilaria domingensis]|nr:hypothetical protein FGB62_22g847 [Gracilaria domingensis]
MPSLASRARSTQYQTSTPPVNKCGSHKTGKVSSDAESWQDSSSRAVSICGGYGEPLANESRVEGPVKSKLPSEEPVPHVEAGFVKRAVRSYTFNIANATNENDPVTRRQDTASLSNTNRQYNFSELVEHSVVSSRSESPISDVGINLGKRVRKEDLKTKVKRSDDFKSSYVARIAESLDYFIEHEQSARTPGLRPISPISR